MSEDVGVPNSYGSSVVASNLDIAIVNLNRLKKGREKYLDRERKRELERELNNNVYYPTEFTKEKYNEKVHK